jgi:hypothetical protein
MREIEERMAAGEGMRREPLYRQIQEYIRTAKSRKPPPFSHISRLSKSPVLPAAEFYFSTPSSQPNYPITRHYSPSKRPRNRLNNYDISLSPLRIQPATVTLHRRSCSWLAVRRRTAIRVRLKLPASAKSLLRQRG